MGLQQKSSRINTLRRYIINSLRSM